MLFCPTDNFLTRESGALYCAQCGDALCHPCPSCGRVIPTHVVNVTPTQRCPGCDAALWQCCICGWLATPGHADCENPACPRGSLVPLSRGCSQLGGGSGRTGQYKVPGSMASGKRFLAAEPPFTRIPILGEIRGVAAGIGRLWLFCGQPGTLHSVTLPAPFTNPLSSQPSAFGERPHPEAEDPIAILGERLYLLTAAGAVIRSETVTERTLPGEFVSQCLHERGWLLIEASAQETVIHRRTLEGDLIGTPTNFAERRQHPGWCLPVADEQAAYLTDDQGRAWRFPWDGGDPSALGTAPGVPTTLMLADGILYVLPAGAASVAGQAITLATGQQQALAPVQRPTLAFALDANRLWLGRTGAETSAGHLVSLDRRAPATSPQPIPGVPETVTQLCALSGPGNESAIIALLKGNTSAVVRGWYSDPPFAITAPFTTILSLPDAQTLQGMTCCDAWLCVWSGKATGSEILLYHLAT